MFEEMHQGGEDLIGKEIKPTTEFSHISGASLVELNIDSVVLDGTCHENVVCDEDIKAISELVIGDMLNQENCSSFILDAGINRVDSIFAGMVLDEDNAGAQARPTMFRDWMGRKYDACELFCEMPSKIMWDDILSDIETHGILLQLVMGCEMHNVLPCFASIDTISQVIDNHDEGEVLLVVCHELLSPGKPSTRSARYWLKEWPPFRCNAFSPGKLKMKCNRYVFDIAPSWRKNDFSPGRFELTRRIWNPGIQNSKLSEAPHDCLLAQLLQIKWQIENRHRGVCHAKHDVAWGQATFRQGGSVTPGPWSILPTNRNHIGEKSPK
ncbi:hypothetical protein SEVIR_9G187000v4 [Setaria viridis]|uniref:Uncharacterized protein n=1 Tax=Setaria viridis TaxID=4556 RepID=A0A4U6SWF6_SETVI|nr:hypothetical protein SEVIR_9G187000v2 [Setaria viridis]TKV92842.1 hypothetical protein SEVIR_9G187000v2 [Setaria viridis]